MKPLKGQTVSFFGEGCRACVQRFDCMSATSVASDERRYLLKLRGYHQKANKAMKRGTELHHKWQEGIPTLTEYGVKKFQKDLLKGKKIQISEAQVCVIPETKITTPTGLKQIKYIKEGEVVINHRGEEDTVIQTFIREVDEEIVEIKLKGEYKSLKCTKNHPILAIKKRNTKNNGRADYPTKLTPRWITAGDLGKGDLVAIPKYKVANTLTELPPFWQDNNYFYVPIREYAYIHYTGEVHNLSVKEGESYIANGVTTHNCSPKYGLKGFVDILDVIYTKDGKFKVTIKELKTGAWHKHYIYQVISYGLMFSDPNCQIHYDKKGRKKMKHIPTRLYPMGALDLDIDIILEFIPSGRQLVYNFMTGGIVSGTMAGLVSATLQRKKKRQKYHNTGLYYLEDTPECGWCKHDDKFCSLWTPVCSKITYKDAPKSKQMYYGKSKMLVKTKPKGAIKRK